jgi:hypothetical protein
MPTHFPIGDKPVVLIDLDDTLAEYDGYKGWKDIGEPRPYAQEFVLTFKKYDWITVLWSTRSEFGYLRDWLEKHSFSDPEYGEGLANEKNGILLFDYIGTWPVPFPYNPAKPVADLMIDDRMWPFCGEPVPLKEVMRDLLSREILQRPKDKK